MMPPATSMIPNNQAGWAPLGGSDDFPRSALNLGEEFPDLTDKG